MEQYVKGFQRFHAGEDMRPVTSCKFLPFISSLLQSATSVITKCDSFFYYKVRWSVITKCDSFFITKCDSLLLLLSFLLSLLLLSMMTLITGFTCPPTIYFKFITKCDKCYYKVRQLLQSVTILLQSATGITKCNDYYKVRQYIRHVNINDGILSAVQELKWRIERGITDLSR